MKFYQYFFKKKQDKTKNSNKNIHTGTNVAKVNKFVDKFNDYIIYEE